MLTCDSCTVVACKTHELGDMPANCPMRDSKAYADLMAEYGKPENAEFFKACTLVEQEGYCRWNRVREIIELCRKMDYQKIGLAFCVGFHKEAKIFCKILRARGITVEAVCCKNGSFDKTDFGVPEEGKLRPGDFEASCNPIGQARFLSNANVDLFVVLGLCVGHDSLFIRFASRYSDAPVTVLAVKDRVTGNNPCAVLYGADGYFKETFGEKVR